jgi:hypothetical protein
MGLAVSINDCSVSGLLHATITTSNYFSAGSFSLTFALADPLLVDIVSTPEISSPYVIVRPTDADFSASSIIITGMIDSLVVDPIMQTVSMEGRDLSSRFIDSYLQRDFVNQTASEIVEAIAADHGLLAIATATTGNVGRYFEDGYTKLSLGQFSKMRSNWDLMVQLARELNFDLFVLGSTLVFQPAADASDIAARVRPGDVTGMRLEKNLAIEPSPNVRVQSWNSQQMASYCPGTPSTTSASSSAGPLANPQGYLFSRSNLTSAQADQTRQQFANEVGRLRAIFHAEMPWDLSISARSVVLLQGTGTSFDGLYQIDSLERHYSSVTGSSQTVRAVSWPASN